jgi:hypothetical protein
MKRAALKIFYLISMPALICIDYVAWNMAAASSDEFEHCGIKQCYSEAIEFWKSEGYLER